MRELRLLRKIRRCGLVIPRRVAENIRDGLAIRAVIVPQGQDPISDCVSYADAVSLSAVGKLRQRLLKLGIERCPEVWIQFYKDFVSCRSVHETIQQFSHNHAPFLWQPPHERAPLTDDSEDAE